MKKNCIAIILFTQYIAGMAMAEPGVPKVNEVQGLSVSTTVVEASKFNAMSSMSISH